MAADTQPEPAAKEPSPVVWSPVADVLFIDEAAYVQAVSRRRQEVSAAPQAVTLIDYGGEYRQPPWTVPDRLRYEAGLDVMQRRHGQFDVGIRGMVSHNADRTLVLRDGREFSIESFGQVPWLSHVHQSDVNRIEVVKGPSSVTYGANAFSGVVSMVGRSVGDVHEQHVWMDAGDGLLDVDSTVLGPINQVGSGRAWYKVSAGGASRRDFDGSRGVPPQPHALAVQTGDDDLTSIRTRIETGYAFAHDLTLVADLGYVDVDRWDVLENFSPGSNYMDMTDLSGGLRLETPFGRLQWEHRDYSIFYSNQRSTFDPIADGMELYAYTQIQMDTSSDRLRYTYDGSFGDHHPSFGAEWFGWQGASGFWQHDGSNTESLENIAVFAEDQWEPDRRWVVSAGLRYDHHSEVSDHLSPRVAVNYRPNDDEFYRFAYSSGYRLPSTFELFIDEWYFQSADDLDVETVQSVDLGWTRELRRLQSRLQIGGFYNRVDDSIQLMPLDAGVMAANWVDWLMAGPDVTVPPGPFFEYRNVDVPIDILGVEVEWRSWFARRRGQFWTTATYQHYEWSESFRYQSDGFIDPISGNRIFAFDFDLGQRDAPPPLKINLGGMWSWDSGWFASGVLRWVDEQDLFVFSAAYFASGQTASVYHRPSFFCLDLGLGYHWPNADGLRRFVRLSLLDAFDSAHYEATRVSEQTLTGDNEWQWSSAIGRQFALVAGWEF